MAKSPAPEPIRYDLRYLMAEIEALVQMAERGGLGTLAHLLELALLEAKRQAQQAGEDDRT